MVNNYNPNVANTHTICITFNNKGYKGQIAYNLGGNCKGLDIINNAEDFIEECGEDDINNLIINNCKFSFDEDSETFSLVLTNDNGESRLFDDVEEHELKAMVVGVEIIAYEYE